jgi:hypothetical protein
MCIWNPNPEFDEVINSNIEENKELTDALILENIRLKEELIFPQITTDDITYRVIH